MWSGRNRPATESVFFDPFQQPLDERRVQILDRPVLVVERDETPVFEFREMDSSERGSDATTLFGVGFARIARDDRIDERLDRNGFASSLTESGEYGPSLRVSEYLERAIGCHRRRAGRVDLCTSLGGVQGVGHDR